MKLALIALALSTATFPASAQGSRAPESVTVRLSNFDFTPSRIILQHGRSYLLHLVNAVGGGHDFDADRFFAAASVDTADQEKISHGKVEVRGRQTIDIHLVAPAAGTYPLHCSHFGHAMLGMTGQIVVQ